MIEIQNLSYSIKDKDILKNISLSATKNEIVGLIGANGSGKSTILKNIYKSLSYINGSIKVQDEEVNELTNKQLARKIAVVAQDNDASFDFTVEEVVIMGRYAKKGMFVNYNDDDYTLCNKILTELKIEKLKKQSYLTLSGGERQKVLLARALIQETDILILDEPTNHLDIGAQLQMLKKIKSLNKTILVALHDINFALSYCDRVYILDKGEIYSYGYPADVITEEMINKLYDASCKIIDFEGKPLVVFK